MPTNRSTMHDVTRAVIQRHVSCMHFHVKLTEVNSRERRYQTKLATETAVVPTLALVRTLLSVRRALNWKPPFSDTLNWSWRIKFTFVDSQSRWLSEEDKSISWKCFNVWFMDSVAEPENFSIRMDCGGATAICCRKILPIRLPNSFSSFRSENIFDKKTNHSFLIGLSN